MVVIASLVGTVLEGIAFRERGIYHDFTGRTVGRERRLEKKTRTAGVQWGH